VTRVFCSQCGAANDVEGTAPTFCGNCGAQLASAARPGGNKGLLIGAVGVVVLAGLFLALWLTLGRKPENSGQEAVQKAATEDDERRLRQMCVSNMKQVQLAVLMYANEYDDVLPSPATTASLQPYLKNISVVNCPKTAQEYTWNLDMFQTTFEGRTLPTSETAIEAPALAVAHYEGTNKQIAGIHLGLGVVGFIDGHVRTAAPGDEAKMAWRPDEAPPP
jgi:hypothetical protein